MQPGIAQVVERYDIKKSSFSLA
ncbi:hypothetical protein IFVP22_C1280181 [Vibrio parahaemolyticus]